MGNSSLRVFLYILGIKLYFFWIYKQSICVWVIWCDFLTLENEHENKRKRGGLTHVLTFILFFITHFGLWWWRMVSRRATHLILGVFSFFCFVSSISHHMHTRDDWKGLRVTVTLSVRSAIVNMMSCFLHSSFFVHTSANFLMLFSSL